MFNFSLPFLGACDLESKLFNLDDFGAAEGPTDWKFVSFKVNSQVRLCLWTQRVRRGMQSQSA